MKRELIRLQKDRSAKIKDMETLLSLTKKEAPKGKSHREMTEEEQQKFDDLKECIENLDAEIQKAKEIVSAEEMIAEETVVNDPVTMSGPKNRLTPEQKLQKKFNILRAIKSQTKNGKLEGAELEAHQEALAEAKRSGISVSGVGIPSFMLDLTGSKRTTLTAGTAATAGNLIQTDLGDIIPALQPKLMVESLGAQVLDNLVGNVDLPRQSALASAAWEAGENDANADINATYDKVSLSPNRLGGLTKISKQLINQESFGVQQIVTRELEGAIARALDLAAINGSGASGEPTGILNTAGIGDVVGGTNGATPDWSDIISLETEVSVDNADMGNLAYLTTPGIRGYLKNTKVDAGSGIFVWPQNGVNLNGYRAEVSTQVPSTLDKGTSTGVCHAIIFGNWSDLIVANWGGLDLVVDEYTLADQALIRIVANSWWDIAVRHAESFAAMKDALTA